MFNYIKGIITDIESNYIVLENNNIGYEIYTSEPYSYEINNEYKIYLYNQIKENETILYGFKTKESKSLFLKLIEVKGLGCKMALPMFAGNNYNNIVDAIEKEDIDYLKKFPKIGDKIARQIILDLKGKIISNNNDNLILLKDALKSLGYKSNDINNVVNKIDSKNDVEKQIKESLKLLRK